MTCHLQFVPRDDFYVDHFLVTKLTYHHGASPEYKNMSGDRRIRADMNVRFDTPGQNAQNDVNIRIAQVPNDQKISRRVYSDEF
jgi:hypothetical protein